MEPRFFVSVIVLDKNDLKKLNDFGFDLFPHTARKISKREFAIDGLLDMTEVGQLVQQGFRVDVKEATSNLSLDALQVIEFDDWLDMIKKEG